jgi:hypothetical protein
MEPIGDDHQHLIRRKTHQGERESRIGSWGIGYTSLSLWWVMERRSDGKSTCELIWPGLETPPSRKIVFHFSFLPFSVKFIWFHFSLPFRKLKIEKTNPRHSGANQDETRSRISWIFIRWEKFFFVQSSYLSNFHFSSKKKKFFSHFFFFLKFHFDTPKFFIFPAGIAASAFPRLSLFQSKRRRKKGGFQR